MTTSLKSANANLRGVTAYAVLAELIRKLTDVQEIELLYVPVPPSVEWRPGATPRLRRHAAEARVTQPPGDSFTETFVEIAERHGDLGPALDVIAFHQPLSAADELVPVRREEATEEYFRELADQASGGQMLVVTSRVRTDAGAAHIPMLDFKVPSCERNTSVVDLIAHRVGGGFLLDSGSSYHFYGDRLLSDHQLREWLLHAQLLSRCVDTRWVTHQLIEGRAALRIGAGGSSGAVPTLISRPTHGADPRP